MVKNTSGGGNAKKQARKHAGGSSSNALRVSESSMEIYACVTKMSGGNLCRVVAQHGNAKLEDLRCHIGGKFRGRNKRNNFLTQGSWVLVGLRDWENPVSNCDLLYVYELDEIDQLKNLPGINLKHVVSEIKSQSNNYDDEEPEETTLDDDCGFAFSENAMSQSEINKIITGNVKNAIQADDDEICIDEL